MSVDDRQSGARKGPAIFGVSCAIVLMVLAALVGLAVVAFFILFSFGLSAWGSNK